MGATRRIDHYAAATGWQPLFIVAGIGAVLIALGFITQIQQLVTSIRDRNERRDTTGDPWNGRTLEWSVASPAPFYNFAKLPTVTQRDPFWYSKGTQPLHKVQYEDIVLPKNSGLGLVIAGFVFLFGFGVVWHMWLVVGVAFIGAILTILVRAFTEETEYVLTAVEVQRLATKRSI